MRPRIAAGAARIAVPRRLPDRTRETSVDAGQNEDQPRLLDRRQQVTKGLEAFIPKVASARSRVGEAVQIPHEPRLVRASGRRVRLQLAHDGAPLGEKHPLARIVGCEDRQDPWRRPFIEAKLRDHSPGAIGSIFPESYFADRPTRSGAELRSDGLSPSRPLAHSHD